MMTERIAIGTVVLFCFSCVAGTETLFAAERDVRENKKVLDNLQKKIQEKQ